MITLETTSEKISAWFRNEGRCAKVLSSLIMSCEIFASAAPLSKTSFGAKSSTDGTTKGTPRPRAPATRHLCQGTGGAGPAPSLDESWVSSASRFDSGTISRSRRNKHPGSNRSKSKLLSNKAALPRFSTGSWRRTQW
jgi:hypothetical protein